MRRFDDWPVRLGAHIAARGQAKFAWGIHDCCVFASDGVLAQTGVDIMAGFRGRYATRGEAETAIRDIAGGDLQATAEQVARFHAMPEIAPRLAQRGDVVLGEFDVAGRPTQCLGLVGLDGRARFAGPVGLARVRLASCRSAWSVGE